MQKLDCSGTASRFPSLLLLSISVLLETNLVCSLTAVPTPLVAPLVQGGFPAVGGIFAGVNIPAVVDPVGVPSECLLLKNMFDPFTEVGDLHLLIVCTSS